MISAQKFYFLNITHSFTLHMCFLASFLKHGLKTKLVPERVHFPFQFSKEWLKCPTQPLFIQVSRCCPRDWECRSKSPQTRSQLADTKQKTYKYFQIVTSVVKKAKLSHGAGWWRRRKYSDRWVREGLLNRGYFKYWDNMWKSWQAEIL